METEIRTLPRSWQKNKVNLVLGNSELDFFEEIVSESSDTLDMKNYILSRIKIARENQ